jgi:protein-tyrosine phosphatase
MGGEAGNRMIPKLYWIEGPWTGRLAVSARPRGGDWLEDEVKGWKASGVDIVVSLLTEEETESFELNEEKLRSQAHGITFLSLPILDRGLPHSFTHAVNFLRDLEKELLNGKTVVVHCRQGLGRAATIAASLLVLSGVEPEKAIQRVSAARGTPVPETVEQSNWVARLAQEGAQVRR